MGIGVFVCLLDEVLSVIVGMGNDIGYFALYFGFEDYGAVSCGRGPGNSLAGWLERYLLSSVHRGNAGVGKPGF